MNRSCVDPRVWLPLALASVVWAGREATQPPPLPPLPHADGVPLPVPTLLTLPNRDQGYDLDPAASCVRFQVEGEGQKSLFQCHVCSGKLDLRADPRDSTLELRLDLASLAPVGAPAAVLATLDLQHLLGVHRGSEIAYRGNLLSTATASPIPGLLQRVWLGTLRFGNRVVRQPIALWQTALPGQPVRMQGYGTVGVEPYGLPRRDWLGLVRERHVVTLGLDLAWKRRQPR